MIDSNQNVLSRNNVRHLEAAIRIRLVLPQNRDRIWIFNRYWNQQNHRSGNRLSIKRRHAAETRAATRSMYRQRRLARAHCHIPPGSFGSLGSQPGKKNVRPALQHNLVAPRGNLQNAIRGGVSLITASQTALLRR